MILQALTSYYKRLDDSPDHQVAQPGYAPQKVSFALLLGPDGTLKEVQDLRVQKGKYLRPRLMLLPTINRAAGIAPQFAWDNTQYVLGRISPDKETQKKMKRVAKVHEAFCNLHRKHLKDVQEPIVRAVLAFLERWLPEQATELANWEEIADTNLVFRLEGRQEYLHDIPAVRQCWAKLFSNLEDEVMGQCLVTGKHAPLARLHPPIKGVDGTSPQGAAMVSFNLPAFVSYGKKQSFNAPTSEAVAFQYTTALNSLLSKSPDNPHRVRAGDTTVVFWAERASPVEGFFGQCLDPGPAEDIDDKLLAAFETLRKGQLPDLPDLDPSVRFYILGLSPNRSRLSVRFWHVDTVGGAAERIGQHFADLAMVRPSWEKLPEFPGLYHLLRETAREAKDIRPKLAGELTRSIIEGTRYPVSVLNAVINRIRAGDAISWLKASLIKAVIVRNHRLSGKKETLSMSLDTQCKDTDYLLGRLFAVLEKLQKDANPGLNKTIKDRYFGSASATPGAVFPRLLRLAQHHIEKAEYGRHVDNLIEQIMADINAFPRHFNLEQQGRFAIGYYQQRNDLYTKKKTEQPEHEPAG